MTATSLNRDTCYPPLRRTIGQSAAALRSPDEPRGVEEDRLDDRGHRRRSLLGSRSGTLAHPEHGSKNLINQCHRAFLRVTLAGCSKRLCAVARRPDSERASGYGEPRRGRDHNETQNVYRRYWHQPRELLSREEDCPVAAISCLIEWATRSESPIDVDRPRGNRRPGPPQPIGFGTPRRIRSSPHFSR
jgi:hypothetical protein